METGHIAALTVKHADIDQQLRAESARPAPDPYRIVTLKKRKLAIKQEIAGLVH